MEDKKINIDSGLNRRNFLTGSAAAAAVFTIVPRHVLGGPNYTAPSDKLNIACVGIGGKGFSDTLAMEKENVAALCDVDENRLSETHGDNQQTMLATFPKTKFYQDFRVMLDKEKSIDAVTVSTPDHTHAVIAMEAMKRGKHVFVQKPLTHTIHEARVLTEAARKYGVITQMGNQGHADEGGRLFNEWIGDGAIGAVTEVHCWTNRPVWPQGIDAPQKTPSVPPIIDWNMWLGPMHWRPYHPAYVPFAWRGFWDFGTGALGDMGAHIIDHPYWALKLKYPTHVEASSSIFTKDSPPIASMVTYHFPARGEMPPLKMIWYDGGLKPQRPEVIEAGRMLGDNGGGVLCIGDRGILMCSVYGRNPRIIPEPAMKEYQKNQKDAGGPRVKIPRSPGIHEEWLEAIKQGNKDMATTQFDYSGPLTETMLLGNVAIRLAEKNLILEYDGEKGLFTNSEEANQYLHIEYRKGWTL
ncbi:MAG: twin-arginine translocation signal domain-containing protein [Calditrichaeota bacterium]|nr:MAG: twin-arginine translocation signal domain-containing protein [Calditrichota bacterium]